MDERKMTGRQFAEYVMWSSEISGHEVPNYDIDRCKKFLRKMNVLQRRNWAKEQLERYMNYNHSPQFYDKAISAFLEEFEY